MKKIFLLTAIVCLFFAFFDVATAQSEQADIFFFYSESCPHCAQEKNFLEKIEKKYDDLVINKYSLAEKSSVELLKQFYNEYDVPEEVWGFVPVTFLKEKYLVGYGGDEITGKEIENCIQECLAENGGSGTEWMEASLKEINVPFLGTVEVSSLSPLFLSMVMGALDGFNACAMVALGFLLSVLVSSGTRKRLILIGGTFILISGLVYFLFISAWFNLFLITFNIGIVTNIVAVVMILSSIFILRDYFSGVVCKLCQVSSGKDNFLTRVQRNLFNKMQRFATSDVSLPVAILGISVVAAGVNMIELACSFGLPMAFTKILTGWNLTRISYYFYLIVYIIFYMIDDFVIFLIVAYTLKMTQASEKYLRTMTLVSGLVLLGLGIIMLINPSLLTLL